MNDDIKKIAELNGVSEEAVYMSGRCWCDPWTEELVFDHRLARAFAIRFDQLLKELAGLRHQLEVIKAGSPKPRKGDW